MCLASCSSSGDIVSKPPTVIRIKGSDTMLPLTTAWVGRFRLDYPQIDILAEGGGSNAGIKALIEGETDLCAASRPLQAGEIRRLLHTRGSLGISVMTAKDALSIYLHPDNPLRSLSLDQVRNIFTGKIGNWSELGGHDTRVTVICRAATSGTSLYFGEHVLQGASCHRAAKEVPTTEEVILRVNSDPGAIGYGGLAYGEHLRHVAIDGIEPSTENVRNGSYPIARYLYLFAAQPLEGHIKTFVDWVLSSAGQAVVRDVGYIPLWDEPGNEP